MAVPADEVHRVARVMDDPGPGSAMDGLSVDDVLGADAWARARASKLIGSDSRDRLWGKSS